jgi:hypothetical protein
MPKVGPKTDVDVDSEVGTRVDEGLAKLYETYEKREAVANQQFVDIINYIKTQKLSKATVKATLESRGLTASSVSTEVSRIMALIKPENEPVVRKLEEGEITIAAARKAIVAKPQERPAVTPQDRLWELLYKAAKYAYKESATNVDFSLKYFTSEAANAWESVKAEYEAKMAEAEEAETEGEEAESEEAMA